jgi:glucosamine--fructose-6-phosphate aminotransferase (isomerizing)
VNLIEEVQKNENIKLGKAVQIALNQVVVLMIAVLIKKTK